ncbi:unnamed protein product [Didymodactylos carnosus]|uniref:Cupin type-1 domain-containing protein n=1 Tax=Didymodactylos carnosus TaxID=1234261 RepID=A0A8S2FLN5_9BILA|nr:unnamed protein product [Didymodactylos carnosus]CAF4291605.1 unnamed protein product [Didymodactylos carnosus]
MFVYFSVVNGISLECPPNMCRSKWDFCGEGPEYCAEGNRKTTTTTITAAAAVNQGLNPKDYIFDFLNSETGRANGTGGQAVAATSKNFPALVSNGMAMTVGYIGPCGINLPHTHPHATEMNLILDGKFQSGFYDFNTNTFVMNEVRKHMVSLFPRGVIHFEQNLNCKPATFVATFNSDVPGVLTIADGFFGLPAEIVGASLGGLSVEKIEDLKQYLPKNPAIGVASCRKRCHLD